MKKEGVIGLSCIAAILVIAVVFFLPKDLDRAMGSGFTLAEVTKIGAHLQPVQGGEALYVELPAGEDAFVSLLTLLNDPHYSRTHVRGDQTEVTLPYSVILVFANDESWAWEYHFSGGRLIEAGPTGSTKTYQVSGGQETQEALLTFLLTQAETAS